MAVEISNGTTVPHATGVLDLLAKLKTFAIANGWTALEDSAEKLVLQGSGAGSDEIFVAISPYVNTGSNIYGWLLNGYTGYTDSLTTFYNQPGAMSANFTGAGGPPAFPIWNSSMPYWFIVNSRRIIVVAKVGTTIQCCYLGFLTPYAMPGQFPYPLVIAGSNINNGGFPVYNDTSTGRAANFMFPSTQSITGQPSHALCYRMPSGSWNLLHNSQHGLNQIENSYNNYNGLWPWVSQKIGLERNTIDGSPILTPAVLQHRNSAVDKGVLGELDGVFHVPGFGQTAESIITYSGDDYLVVNNVYRTGNGDFAAIKLV